VKWALYAVAAVFVLGVLSAIIPGFRSAPKQSDTVSSPSGGLVSRSVGNGCLAVIVVASLYITFKVLGHLNFISQPFE
jgi:hypothetical protein